MMHELLLYWHAHAVRAFAILAAALHVLGALSALHALASVRSAPGGVAWLVSLVTFPYVALPLYWTFGRNKFQGYVQSRRRGDTELHYVVNALRQQRERFAFDLAGDLARFAELERLASMPFTAGNRGRLLIDGRNAFPEMFAAIADAKSYVLVQFFIVRDDPLGRELSDLLVRKAAEGVRVHFLYDAIGSHALPDAYIRKLEAAGVRMRPFGSLRFFSRRFQINFRNHRKIVVTDGRVAFVGGLNIGDEYRGLSRRFPAWRDTHTRFEGPCVQCVQIPFLEDWYWATGEVLDLQWEPAAAPGGGGVLVLPSGPADVLDTCSLAYVQSINDARERVWLVSPYFVPPPEVIAALQLAALRGVDVRILLPLKPDHRLVYLASFYYLRELNMNGIRFFRYEPGFLHQKALLIDDDLAAVGTANADNRSFSLNFELMMYVVEPEFVKSVERMLDDDFARSRSVPADELDRRRLPFRLAVHLARLLSPVL
ncbi:MAG: cardiolipin synthase [Kiritimatiellia bacterium]